MHIDEERPSGNTWNGVQIQEVGQYDGKHTWGREGGEMVSRNEVAAQVT